MKTVALFVGANNVTKELEAGKLQEIVGRRFDGFTIVPSIGMWKGDNENSCIVLIAFNDTNEYLFDKDIANTIIDIKAELKQEAVGVMTLPEMMFR